MNLLVTAKIAYYLHIVAPESPASPLSSDSPISAATAAKLTRRIRQHPEDATAYLAYADLLQQRGDPRGEFIQICHRATEGDTPALHQARQDYLNAWSGKLLGKLKAAWASGTIDTEWRLGFLESVRVRPGPARAY